MLPKIQRGDIFLTRSESILGASIRAVEGFWSKDGNARYNHAGFFFESCPPESIEALPDGVTGRRWPEEFQGERILIARHDAMDDFRFWQGYERVERELGKRYPYHRLFLHILKPLAEINVTGMNVCSEIVQMFCFFAGLTSDRFGWNPDDFEELVWEGKPWRVVWGGVP